MRQDVVSLVDFTFGLTSLLYISLFAYYLASHSTLMQANQLRYGVGTAQIRGLYGHSMALVRVRYGVTTNVQAIY